MIRHLLVLLFALLPMLGASAQGVNPNTPAATNGPAQFVAEDESDTIIVSLLTCSPGDEIHRLYGHTALRLQTPAEDWAVNFGWFSFNTPNFVMKFILGLTDYSMAYQTLPIFISDLMRDDMGVTEQVLNLTTEEALTVSRGLKATLDSEGFDRKDYTFSNSTTGEPNGQTILGARWTYRYNFLYDNCTTRAVQVVEEALRAHGESLVYPTLAAGGEPTTQRKMIHEFTRTSPWFEFGQDMLLGPEVDEEHSVKELAEGLNFLPTYAQNFFQQAQIRDKGGRLRPLVATTQSLTPFLVPAQRTPSVPFGPKTVAWAVLVLAMAVSVGEWMAERKSSADGAVTATQRAWRIWSRAFDFTCWTGQTLVGILLVIMVGWSEHPAVGTNWLLLLFNPLFVLGIPVRLWMGRVSRYFAAFTVLMAVLTLLVGVVGLQSFPGAIFILTLVPIVRAARDLWQWRKPAQNKAY